MTENRLTHKNSDSPKPTKAQKMDPRIDAQRRADEAEYDNSPHPRAAAGTPRRLDAIAGRLVIERRIVPHTLDRDHFVSDSSANVGSRPAGVSLSTTPAKSATAVLSALLPKGPSAVPAS